MLLEMALNWRLKASQVRSSLKVAPRDPHFTWMRSYDWSREATSHAPAESTNFVSWLHNLALLQLSGWNAGFSSLYPGWHLSACFFPFSSSFREDQPWAFWLSAKSSSSELKIATKPSITTRLRAANNLRLVVIKDYDCVWRLIVTLLQIP